MIEPSDQEFRYIGLDEAQIDRLRIETQDLDETEGNEARWIVYYAALRLLMEEDSDHDSLPGDLHLSRQSRWVVPGTPNGRRTPDVPDDWLFSSPAAVEK